MRVAPLCKAVIRWVTPDPNGMKHFAFEENKYQQGKHSEYYPILVIVLHLQASQVALVVKNLPANPGDIRDADANSGLGRCPGRGHGNSLQYSCLENPMDREAWQATVHNITKNQTWLKRLSMHACMHCFFRLTGKLEKLGLKWRWKGKWVWWKEN